MTLKNGALPSNIFWLANTAITFNNTTGPIYGNFILPGTQPTGTFTATITSTGDICGNIWISRSPPGNYGSVVLTGVTQVDVMGTMGCYLKGIKILTKNGYTRIEDLNVGDEIITKGGIEQQ
jgi:hypothetical protein